MVLIHIISSSQKARILRLYSFIPFQQKNVPFISSLHPTNARILRLLCMKIRSKIRTNERILRQYSFISFQQKNVPLISFLHPKNARILRLYSFISFQQKMFYSSHFFVLQMCELYVFINA